jgi:hypothetical protein
MRNFWILVGFCGVVPGILGFDGQLLNRTGNSDPQYLEFSFSFPDKSSKFSEVRLTLLRDIPNLFMKLTLKFLNSNFVVCDNTFNACFIEKYRRANVFTKYFLGVLIDNLDFTIRCPLKKGNYTLKERDIDIAKNSLYIPSFLQINDTVKLDISLFFKQRGEIKNIFEVHELWAIFHNGTARI